MTTVSEAIKKGENIRTILAFQVFWLVPIMIYIAFKEISFIYFLASLFILLIIQVVLQTYFIQKWRIWALSNVDNPLDFKKRAEELWLIPNGSKLDKFEFQSKNYKHTWEELQKRYKEPIEPVIIQIPEGGITIERCILKSNNFLKSIFRPYEKQNFYIDKDKILVNNNETFLLKDIYNESIDLNLCFNEDAGGRVYEVSFDHFNERVILPISPKVDVMYIEKILRSLGKLHEPIVA